MRPCATPIADLLPHAPPMVLLDDVLGWDQGQVRVAVTIRPDSPFCESGRGVPAHVGIEYMAQACGVYAGLEGLSLGLPVRLGYLLGTRRFQAAVSWFRLGERLEISVTEVFRDQSMGVFDCRIDCAGCEVAAAQLNVYQPEDASAVLGGSSGE
ncbi:MAG TPA: hotdog family protein [Patescibacteria group bacterium]|nr:hotdog family protein [Patescibacteria group bacterium]